MKLYKQRIKHLLFEHQSESTDARTDGQVSLKMAQARARGEAAEAARRASHCALLPFLPPLRRRATGRASAS